MKIFSIYSFDLQFRRKKIVLVTCILDHHESEEIMTKFKVSRFVGRFTKIENAT